MTNKLHLNNDSPKLEGGTDEVLSPVSSPDFSESSQKLKSSIHKIVDKEEIEPPPAPSPPHTTSQQKPKAERSKTHSARNTTNRSETKSKEDFAAAEVYLFTATDNPDLRNDSDRKAFLLFKRAAQAGHLQASGVVGFCYDFGIGVASQVVVSLAREFFFELLVVGQLTVETKTEPLVFVDVLALKGLSVVPVVLAAGRIPHVSDGCRADKLLHDRLVLAAMRETKDFADRSDVLVGIEQQRPFGIIAGHSSGQLAAVLDVLQHPGHQGRT